MTADYHCDVVGIGGYDLEVDNCFYPGEAHYSAYLPDTGLGWHEDNIYCLVKSYDDECSCQHRGYEFAAIGFCHILEPWVQSYRIYPGPCGPDTCW